VDYTWGTINCNCLDAKGNIGGVTTTSGLSYKIPGRVGDSPIIGAGLYVDNRVGAAGSTGRGEANLQNCSSFAVVELMRGGMSPTEASLEACKRIAERALPRLRRPDGKPAFDVKFYALTKDGRFGGASIWSGAQMAVADAEGPRLEDLAHLYVRDWKEE
jgi:N4-(beta-N-acetylglucosaminyl)-L-asparaginase